METKHDEEFGLLTKASGGWELEKRAVLAGAEVPLVVEADEEGGFEPQQRQAVRLALAVGPNALEEAAPAVVQNYEVYREAIDDQEQTPQLQSLADVWQQVHIDRIQVPLHGDAQNAYFLLLAECDWDPEHGLEVRFRNGQAIEASQQGETGGTSDDPPEHLDELRRTIDRAASQALRQE